MLKKSAVLLAIVSGCQSPSSPDSSRDALVDPRPVTPIVHEVYTGFDEPARFVVRDAGRWADVWNRTFVGRSEMPQRPTINFSKEMVLVAAQGGQGSSGYDISIDQVTSQAGATVAHVTSTSPDEHCVVLAVITSPVMMVRIPVSTNPVQFVEHARLRLCD
jgi:hypothetical protein